jgi:hypothetical protein
MDGMSPRDLRAGRAPGIVIGHAIFHRSIYPLRGPFVRG